MYRKLMTFTFATMLTAGLAFAQDTTNTSTSSQTQQTSVGQPTDTNEPLYKGCVSGTKDNYVLTTEDGKMFRLHSDKDINEHVGKFVEIKGTVKKEGADRPADAQVGGSKYSEMDVADVKNVDGKSCPSTTSDASAVKSEDSAAVASTEAKPEANNAGAPLATADKSTDPSVNSTMPEAKKEDATTQAGATTEPAKDSSASSSNFYGTQAATTTSTEQAKVEDKPVTDNAAVATEEKKEDVAVATEEKKEDVAVATEQKSEEVKPEANAAVSTDSSAMPQNDQAATSTEAPKADNAVAADQSATASNADAQNNTSDAAALPQTASPLPLLGLLGFASTGIGFLARRRK